MKISAIFVSLSVAAGLTSYGAIGQVVCADCPMVATIAPNGTPSNQSKIVDSSGAHVDWIVAGSRSTNDQFTTYWFTLAPPIAPSQIDIIRSNAKPIVLTCSAFGYKSNGGPAPEFSMDPNHGTLSMGNSAQTIGVTGLRVAIEPFLIICRPSNA